MDSKSIVSNDVPVQVGPEAPRQAIEAGKPGIGPGLHLAAGVSQERRTVSLDDQHQVEPDPPAEGQWSDAQLRFLKRAIAVMSTILVLGFATVVGRLIYLSSQSTSQKLQATTGARIGTATVAKLAAAAQLALPANSVVRSVSLSGVLLAVHYTAPSGNGIAIIDLTTGKPASRIRLTMPPADK